MCVLDKKCTGNNVCFDGSVAIIPCFLFCRLLQALCPTYCRMSMLYDSDLSMFHNYVNNRSFNLNLS